MTATLYCVILRVKPEESKVLKEILPRRGFASENRTAGEGRRYTAFRMTVALYYVILRVKPEESKILKEILHFVQNDTHL